MPILICIILILAGCALFFAMPANMGILSWILFAVGTLLNVIGIFRLAVIIPEAQSDTGKKITKSLTVAIAILLQCFGLVYLYKNHGNGKSIVLATFALCLCLGLIIHAVDFDDEKNRKATIIASRIITVILVAVAVIVIAKGGLSNGSISVAVILAIEAIITGKMGLSKLEK